MENKELYSTLISLIEDEGMTWEKIRNFIVTEENAIEIERYRDDEILPDKLIKVDDVIKILRRNL